MYIIRKGCHYSNRWFPSLTTKTKIHFSFRFVEHPSYKISAENQKDTNKIFGISDGYHHHKDSLRVGWRWNISTQKCEILIYTYRNSIHESYMLCELEDVYSTNNCHISIGDGYYQIDVNNYTYTLKRTSKWDGIRYLLFPYFGGQEVAPKEFKIKIERL